MNSSDLISGPSASGSSPAWDAIVVGGSAAGLSAALMLGRARRRVLVIDAGSPRNRFAAHMHGVLGNEGTAPAELVGRGRAEVAAYGVEVREGTVERVSEIAAGAPTSAGEADARLTVAVSGAAPERTRALIVATGIADELPAIPGLAERWGTSVLHCPYCHGWEVRDRRIGVIATSPMALHQARLVRQWSDRVVLFSAAAGEIDAADAQRLRSRGVEVETSPVVEVLGDGDAVTGVRTADGRVTEVGAIFTAGAPRPHDGFLADLDLARTEQPFGLGSFLTVDFAGRTSHERIWGVGNVVNPMANVPIAMAAGAMAGGAANGALVEADFDLAVRATSEGSDADAGAAGARA
ncbi:NAD(P)/FAD-dependent oxidoreductase [Agrococcus sp. Marseille-P2731]|uniref:NAD(P)/FAD-dependent oxidoreductase n=1 Tax=Agrococcus sp. Marseille-P2731 TaxID=1841862 RepID=UPI000931968D|nr:NAD(P)/FAD-dependent oxidoreductase [Agrococcus sp. Marseille-P2731]